VLGTFDPHPALRRGVGPATPDQHRRRVVTSVSVAWMAASVQCSARGRQAELAEAAVRQEPEHCDACYGYVDACSRRRCTSMCAKQLEKMSPPLSNHKRDAAQGEDLSSRARKRPGVRDEPAAAASAARGARAPPLHGM